MSLPLTNTTLRKGWYFTAVSDKLSLGPVLELQNKTFEKKRNLGVSSNLRLLTKKKLWDATRALVYIFEIYILETEDDLSKSFSMIAVNINTTILITVWSKCPFPSFHWFFFLASEWSGLIHPEIQRKKFQYEVTSPSYSTSYGN